MGPANMERNQLFYEIMTIYRVVSAKNTVTCLKKQHSISILFGSTGIFFLQIDNIMPKMRRSDQKKLPRL